MKHTDANREELEPLAGVTSHHEEHDASQEPSSSTRDGVLDDARDFVAQFDLSDKLETFQKAALLIHGDGPVSRVPGITQHEVRALQKEVDRKWSQPFEMYLVTMVTAIGAVGQGWAQTSMNGANLYFPKLFGIGSKSTHDTLLVGVINCGIYLSNGLLGAWLVAPINDKLGRRGAVFAAALVVALATLAGGAAGNWQQLLACRLLLGCGLGIISSTLNIFAAECAPATIRGGLAVSWQMFCAFGIFVGFAANMAIDQHHDYGPLRWRIELTAPILSAIPLIILIFFCPESPAWYVKHASQYGSAFESLCILRNTELQAAKELYTVYLQQQHSSKTTAKPSFFVTLFELFTIPRIRRSTLASYTSMIAQQLCGINIIAFYSAVIFREANFTPYASLLASTIFGLVNFVGAFPAIWTMDTLGRRSLLLLTLPLMAATMATAGLSFSIDEPKTRFYMITSMIYLFCLLYSPGMGPVPAAYSAEVFPLSHREMGASSAIAITNLFASALSLTFPWLLFRLGNQRSFLLYATLNVLAFVLVFLFVPETKRKTLEELDHVFSVPTGQFIRYQATEVVPWWTKRYLLLQRKATLRPPKYEESAYYEALDRNDGQ